MTTSEAERVDLLHVFNMQRDNLLIAVRGVSDEQARTRSTVSELTLGGIIKHVTRGEVFWTRLMTKRDGAIPDGMLDMSQHVMGEDETIAGLIDAYVAASKATDAAVHALPDLDVEVPLPRWPWAPDAPAVLWTGRRVLLNLLRETSHHCGHADIIREAIDGASTTMQMTAPS